MLALGIDLTTLGLDLTSRAPLSAVFSSPFSEQPTSNGAVDLPACYTVKQVPPLQKRIAQLNELTLFYIFYSMPGDVMQLAAASILYVDRVVH
jgi:CCR4-NOT transcription complex subunit 2